MGCFRDFSNPMMMIMVLERKVLTTIAWINVIQSKIDQIPSKPMTSPLFTLF